MDRGCLLQALNALRLVALGYTGPGWKSIIVDRRIRKAGGPEDQLLHGRGKGKAGFLFDDQGQKIVGRVLFVKELRSWFKHKLVILDLGNQAGGRLMVLQNLIVVGQGV